MLAMLGTIKSDSERAEKFLEKVQRDKDDDMKRHKRGGEGGEKAAQSFERSRNDEKGGTSQ